MEIEFFDGEEALVSEQEERASERTNESDEERKSV
jgi:hypothetical protein